ncbi:uracil phosphoribosyltransferase-domain-containing protein [Aspergillus egyptiacus]|nr:uracil phosphoribosyltransferase-domain-containing protein [Aspergillus egyptiacus]
MVSTNGVPSNASASQNNRITVLDQDIPLLALMTTIRDTTTTDRDFCSAVEKVTRRLITSALTHVPHEQHTIQTPTNTTYQGVRFTKAVCGVSILRAGASMEQVLRETWMGPLSFGKILIQRDEETSAARLYYSKLPGRIAEDVVFLLEPMLATGGSLLKALETLIETGVAEESIVLVNIISSRQGLDLVAGRFPRLKIVTAAVDPVLTDENFISPGLGDFGDRFYGTC